MEKAAYGLSATSQQTFTVIAYQLGDTAGFLVAEQIYGYRLGTFSRRGLNFIGADIEDYFHKLSVN